MGLISKKTCLFVKLYLPNKLFSFFEKKKINKMEKICNLFINIFFLIGQGGAGDNIVLFYMFSEKIKRE